MKRHSIGILGVSTVALFAAAVLGSGAAQAQTTQSERTPKTVTLTANLTELNGSGASGTATATVRNQKIKHIEVHASGLMPDAPHAQHIHYGNQAMQECPTIALDSNGDGRLNTVEGIPAYGPVVVSLTTTGDTSPASLLDVTRFPVSEGGSYHYSRDNLHITKVGGTGYPGPSGTGTAKEIADSIREGEGVVVIHGVDYNGNGEYDFSRGASELDPNLPAEATDPAACGILG
ncbi:hypothetical protein E3O53_00765 [Cryobacterium sp. TMT2-18-3]|uniref:hypothetical protein n=1 Tax=unclassified Cryobacterium TaxID=2649013 RepID=UPI00106D5E73|nr:MULTISPECIES: hypothetical protein [unclassified Cryobacterium]TFC30542.1 hypothetical protein E3O22_03985 [Cryobacterium sp. TMT2-18-2]TFC37134.1 hypothetical protein E3O18_05990 [Cryobacterium sp. TMT2-42-4]TFC68240.1 hypothetical protein E3O53_00765 [Cryobacterium sp. TMT2-18-3]